MGVFGRVVWTVLGKAWAGLKTVAGWAVSSPWRVIGGGLLIRLIRRIREIRYQTGKMSPFAEKMYEIFRPAGDFAVKWILTPLEATAWSTIFYDAYIKEPAKQLWHDFVEWHDAYNLEVELNPRAFGIP